MLDLLQKRSVYVIEVSRLLFRGLNPKSSNMLLNQPWHFAFLMALDIVVSEDKKYKIRLILCLTNNWEAYGGRPQHVKWGKAAGWNLTSVDDFYTDPTLKSYYKTYLKDFAEDFRCRHPICQALGGYLDCRFINCS